MTKIHTSSLGLKLPPLENGDRLTRAEFERRYQAMPSVKKAELIEGMVYMSSPLKIKAHGEPHAHIMGWLVLYTSATAGVGVVSVKLSHLVTEATRLQNRA